MKKKDPTSHRIIEKRRRDRMNNCLADLSRLIPSHYMRKGRGRVEKTEIIEMAIRHLKDLRGSSAGSPRGQQEPDLGQADLPCAQTTLMTGDVELGPAELQTATDCESPLDCTGRAAQQLATVSTSSSPLTDSSGIHDTALARQALVHHNQMAATASLSMRAFQHQQYHNNERQIHSRASEQSGKYRADVCCTCRGRTTARYTESASSSSGASNGISINNSNNSISSSSDQSDTGSIDYPSSSSGSNKTQPINKSASESSSGEGSPTSSSSSSSSSSTGWYKKAWLIRSFSRTVPKN